MKMNTDVRNWYQNRSRKRLKTFQVWRQRWRSGVVRFIERLIAGRNPQDWQVANLTAIQHLPSAAQSIASIRVLEHPDVLPFMPTGLCAPTLAMRGIRRGVYAIEFKDVRAHMPTGLVRLESGHVYAGSDGLVRYANMRGGAAHEDHALSHKRASRKSGQWTIASGTPYYYHHLMDNCIPALKAANLQTDITVGVPDKQAPWFYEAFEVLSLNYEILHEDVVQFESLTYVDRTATNPADINLIRSRLVGDDLEPDLILFISRRGYTRYDEKAEVFLRAHLSDIDVTYVDPGSYSIREQIAIFRRARFIIAPHGGANTNMIYSPQGAKFHEFFSSGFRGMEFASLAYSCGIDYWAYDAIDLGELITRLYGQIDKSSR